MADESYEERKRGYEEQYGKPRSDRVPTYEGFTGYSNETEVEAFILAVRAAAAEAAKDEDGDGISDDGVRLPAWFEITRFRILVGNPNVKVLGATITKSDPP
jgi:hypothetical protein